MQASEKVRAARKKMQLARLEEKSSDGYTSYYEGQPLQRVKAAKNQERLTARMAFVDATEALAVAEITGSGLQAAQEAQTIAALVVHKLENPANPVGSQLSAA